VFRGEATTTHIPAGAPGRDGRDGKDGAHGKDGAAGLNGKDGLPGKDGKDGKDGNPGRDGSDGVHGQSGKDGLDGKTGKDGKDGINGKDGADGKNGLDGADGKDGKNGVDGLPGKNGLDGKDGKHGKDGKDAPLSKWVKIRELLSDKLVVDIEPTTAKLILKLLVFGHEAGVFYCGHKMVLLDVVKQSLHIQPINPEVKTHDDLGFNVSLSGLTYSIECTRPDVIWKGQIEEYVIDAIQ